MANRQPFLKFQSGNFRLFRRRGRGRQPGGFGLGPGGECWCPRCNVRVTHQRGLPCYETFCSKCGQPMTRV